MLSYSLRIGLSPVVSSVSLPASPLPPSPDHHAEYRSAVLHHYNAALSGGLPHVEALKRTSQALKSADHPWHHLDQVRSEVANATGRSRRGV
jgi:hypothetical protein